MNLNETQFNIESRPQPRTAKGYELQREIELRYFLPRARVESLLEFASPQVIRQFYLPKSEVQTLVRGLDLDEDPRLLATLSSARIRETDGICSLELKSSKTGGKEGEISRVEISIPISRSLFEQLLPGFSAGGLEKARYTLPGTIQLGNGRTLSADAQIDIITALGSPLEMKGLLFATVDIEVPDIESAERVRMGAHDFDFLKTGAIDIALQRKEVRKTLSNRNLAKNELLKEEKKALRKLLELCESTN